MNIIFTNKYQLLRVGFPNKSVRQLEFQLTKGEMMKTYRIFNHADYQKLILLEEDLKKEEFNKIFEYRRDEYIHQLIITKEELSPLFHLQIINSAFHSQQELNRQVIRQKHNNDNIFQLKLKEVQEIIRFFKFSLPYQLLWDKLRE